jgi:hypothetical protein
MKKIISYVLMLSLALTIIVSAMPSQQAISTQLGVKQMTKIVGGKNPACGETVACGGGAGWGNNTMNCITDAYSNHGWLSVWATVQSAFIPETLVAIGGYCAGRSYWG